MYPLMDAFSPPAGYFSGIIFLLY